MHKFNAHIFYCIAQDCELVRSAAYYATSYGVTNIPEPIRTEHPLTLEAIIRHCEAIGLETPIPHSRRLLERFEGKYGGCDAAGLDTAMHELHNRIIDEVQSILFMRIPKDRALYYDKPSLFGQDVTDKFPDATYDISEAGSCYATDRYTACVMHLMRSLEVALDAIGLGVGLPDAVIEARNSWETLLKKIRKQVEANDASGDPTWQPKRQFFVDAEAHLYAVKNAWRNPSMHLEKKYDDREALRIYNAVKDFMEHLATHLDASGQFTP